MGQPAPPRVFQGARREAVGIGEHVLRLGVEIGGLAGASASLKVDPVVAVADFTAWLARGAAGACRIAGILFGRRRRGLGRRAARLVGLVTLEQRIALKLALDKG